MSKLSISHVQINTVRMPSHRYPAHLLGSYSAMACIWSSSSCMFHLRKLNLDGSKVIFKKVPHICYRSSCNMPIRIRFHNSPISSSPGNNYLVYRSHHCNPLTMNLCIASLDLYRLVGGKNTYLPNPHCCILKIFRNCSRSPLCLQFWCSFLCHFSFSYSEPNMNHQLCNCPRNHA